MNWPKHIQAGFMTLRGVLLGLLQSIVVHSSLTLLIRLR